MKTPFQLTVPTVLTGRPVRRSTRLAALSAVFVAWHWANAQPYITNDPTNASVSLGATAQFTVTATSASPPMTCEWWFKDAKLDAAANPSAATSRLSLTNVTLAQAGPYYVVVSDQSGSVTSQPAILDVDPTFTKITQGPLVTDRLNSVTAMWGDCDGDGLLDVLVTGPANQWRLYHNDGSAQFSTVTSGAMGQHNQGMPGVWGDPDNDGDLDFYAGPTWSASESPAMYWDDGQGNFVRQPVGPSWTSNKIPLRGVLWAWNDFDRDGFLDAFLGGCFAGITGTAITNALLHNNGDGRFAVVTNSVLNLRNHLVNNLCAEDYDGDGAVDLVLIRTTGSLATAFYRNDGQGVFAEATPEPIRSEVYYAMYLTWADFDNDGDLDAIFGGYDSQPYGLDQDHFYINNRDGTFSSWAGQPSSFDGTLPAGWGVAEGWGDFDNDGYLDWFTTAPSTGRLWRNLGNGSFERVNCGSPVQDSTYNANQVCWVDFNNDGFLDLFEPNLGFPPGSGVKD